MCRMAGWQGQSRPLSSLLYDTEHALTTQAWSPREMLFGNVNVDGTGVAWWPPGEAGAPPLRYVTPAAAWNDANLPALSSRIAGESIIAAVRSATAGIPFGPVNVAPFVRGNVALAHNGFIQGFRTGVGRILLAKLSDQAFEEFDAVSDSQVTLLLIRTRLAEGLDLVEAVTRSLADITKAVTDAGVGAAMNLLVSDGQTMVATRSSVSLGHNSLYVCSEPDGTTIASEPLDTERIWEKVPPESLVVVRAGQSDVHALPEA